MAAMFAAVSFSACSDDDDKDVNPNLGRGICTKHKRENPPKALSSVTPTGLNVDKLRLSL